MIKTLNNIFRQDKERFAVPKSVQQAIAIQTVWNDGIFILYRKEYNTMLLDKATGADGMVQEKYVTVSAYRKSIEEARTYFCRTGTELAGYFARLGSKCVEMDATDRLRALYDFYRAGEETGFHFDLVETMRKGHSFKDFICPDSLEFEKRLFPDRGALRACPVSAGICVLY